MDLADDAAIARAVADVRPEWVVHAAAMTNVDACERDPAAAMRVNGHAAGVVAAASRRASARTLCISTDYVFSGDAGPYAEGDATGPVQEYGRSKLAGEQAVLVADPDAVVARTAIVFGPHKTNFVLWLLGELDAGRTVRIVEDQWVTPTHTLDLVDQVMALIEGNARGTYHTAGTAGLTRLAMAQAVCRVFQLDADLVTPIKAADLTWLAKRPRDSRLRTDAIAKLKTPVSFDDALLTLKAELGR